GERCARAPVCTQTLEPLLCAGGVPREACARDVATLLDHVANPGGENQYRAYVLLARGDALRLEVLTPRRINGPTRWTVMGEAWRAILGEIDSPEEAWLLARFAGAEIECGHATVGALAPWIRREGDGFAMLMARYG